MRSVVQTSQWQVCYLHKNLLFPVVSQGVECVCCWTCMVVDMPGQSSLPVSVHSAAKAFVNILTF